MTRAEQWMAYATDADGFNSWVPADMGWQDRANGVGFPWRRFWVCFEVPR